MVDDEVDDGIDDELEKLYLLLDEEVVDMYIILLLALMLLVDIPTVLHII
jgi:hypothetical protein